MPCQNLCERKIARGESFHANILSFQKNSKLFLQNSHLAIFLKRLYVAICAILSKLLTSGIYSWIRSNRLLETWKSHFSDREADGEGRHIFSIKDTFAWTLIASLANIQASPLNVPLSYPSVSLFCSWFRGLQATFFDNVVPNILWSINTKVNEFRW